MSSSTVLQDDKHRDNDERDSRRINMISEAQYRAIDTPTLVVWTSHDPTATPAEGAEIADMLKRGRFIVMNRCGHWPQ